MSIVGSTAVEKETATNEVEAPDLDATKHRSRTRQVLTRLARNRGAAAALIILLFLIAVAILAPVLAPQDPIKINPANNLRPPSPSHLMGTDDIGRDILSRVIYGSRLSLTMGLISVAIATLIGTIIGLISGYWGGSVDVLIMGITEIMMALPGILLALVIVTVLGRGLTNVMIAVGISWVPSYARLARSSVLAAKEQDYILAARVLGASNSRILFRHILPNIVMPIIVLSTMGVSGAILTGASLSFLGLGAQPPAPEWGAMLNQARRYVRVAWWWMTFPGLAIMITVLSTSMFGDGLRDALDPKLYRG